MLRPRHHPYRQIRFQKIENVPKQESGVRLIVAGEKVPITDPRVQDRYFYVEGMDTVGTHGAIAYRVTPFKEQDANMRHGLLDCMSEGSEKERIMELFRKNAVVAHIRGRDVLWEYQTKRGQPQAERLNIGRRLFMRAIQDARREGAKFVYAFALAENARRSQEAAGMMVLGPWGLGWLMGKFLDEKVERKNRGK